MHKDRARAEAEGELRVLPPFASLAERSLHRLAEDSEWCELAQGETFAHGGAAADRLWVVTTGCCSLVYRRFGDQRVVWFGEAPVVVGEQALLPPPVAYPTSITADGRCTAIALSAERVRRCAAAEPEFACALLEAALRRDAELLSQLDVVTTPGAEERVAKYLTYSAVRIAEHDWRVAVPVSRKHLAHLLALTPETLSRVLKRFRHRGWVENAQRGLRIVDRAAVRAAQGLHQPAVAERAVARAAQQAQEAVDPARGETACAGSGGGADPRPAALDPGHHEGRRRQVS